MRVPAWTHVLAVFLSLAGTAGAEVRLSAADCARVVAHVPEPSVAFRPGVDSMGRSVAPADLVPPQAVMPPVPWFVLSVDLAERLRPVGVTTSGSRRPSG